jgi:methionyl-tRNA formyltransferase
MYNIKMNLVFFGSSQFSVYCLDTLKLAGVLPDIIITTPDQKTGRGLINTPTPVKIWARAQSIECLDPAKLTPEFTEQLKIKITSEAIFLVASYGKIVPRRIIDLPKHKTLNIHPSLLPKYRGPSPIQQQIINNDNNVGVSLMLIDEQIDHGPIIASRKIDFDIWPADFDTVE